MNDKNINSGSSDNLQQSDSVKKAVSPGENLPKYYGRDRLVLLVRDPYWLHAYWSIGKKLEEIKSLLGPEVWETTERVLRVFDVTGVTFDGNNANSYFDIKVNPDSRNWYVNVPNPDCEYIAEYAAVTNDGRYIMMMRSNSVRTPRDSVYEHFVMPDEEGYEGEYSPDSPEFKARQKIYDMSGYDQEPGLSSQHIMEHIAKRLEQEMNVSSHGVSSFSSAALAGGAGPGEEGKKRSFWLVADTELIVYGATEPTAHLTVQGQTIDIRKDGTFTLRFALPDGKQVIPIVAVSEDKVDTKSITFTVQRDSEADL